MLGLGHASSASVTRIPGGWQRRGVNEVSLEEAYAKYADELVRYATLLVPRSAAADVVADTFADLLRDPDGAWSTAHKTKAYLFGAVANRARMYHRHTERRRHREERVAAAERRTGDVEVTVSRDVVLDAFDELSVQQRAVTYLTYWHDLSVAQVAEILGVRDGTVRRQLARARSRLRGALS